ncbi:hypothetical protein H1C71_000812, partial [Ictidomys tridecemlineatus]
THSKWIIKNYGAGCCGAHLQSQQLESLRQEDHKFKTNLRKNKQEEECEGEKTRKEQRRTPPPPTATASPPFPAVTHFFLLFTNPASSGPVYTISSPLVLPVPPQWNGICLLPPSGTTQDVFDIITNDSSFPVVTLSPFIN